MFRAVLTIGLIGASVSFGYADDPESNKPAEIKQDKKGNIEVDVEVHQIQPKKLEFKIEKDGKTRKVIAQVLQFRSKPDSKKGGTKKDGEINRIIVKPQGSSAAYDMQREVRIHVAPQHNRKKAELREQLEKLREVEANLRQVPSPAEKVLAIEAKMEAIERELHEQNKKRDDAEPEYSRTREPMRGPRSTKELRTQREPRPMRGPQAGSPPRGPQFSRPPYFPGYTFPQSGPPQIGPPQIGLPQIAVIQRGPGGPPQHPEMERMEHLRIAAKHLSHAGKEEMARDLRNEAEEMERDLHRSRGGPPNDEMRRHMEEMHEQMQAFRREVRELQERVEQLSRRR